LNPENARRNAEARKEDNRLVSVVVPVFNSEEILPLLIERLEKVLPGLCADYEIVLVNDGSKDRSWEVMKELASAHPSIVALDLTRNFGQHNALLCGIRHARHPVIVTMDDDLQNPPEEIGKLLSALGPDLDVVYGVPARQEHGAGRVLASILVKWALKASMRVDIAPYVQPFRAFRTELRQAFADHSAPDISIDVLLTWGTDRFGRVFVEHNPRRYGKSNYSLRKLFDHAFNMITGYSVIPLRAASLLGFSLTLLGAAFLVVTIVNHFLFGGAPRGFTFLASAISIFSGAQLFFLGVIGEYLGRIHNRTMNRPAYVVRCHDGEEQTQGTNHDDDR